MLTEVITAESRAKKLTETIDAAIDRLVAELAQGHTQEYLRLLRFWSRFHRYSHGNALLILSQRPDATQVAGYHTWRRAGRLVSKGAKAVVIWCPIIRSVPDPDTGLPIELLVGFNPCPVFAAEDLVDIASNPLPTLWRPLPDDAEALYRYLKTKVEEGGYRVDERRLPPGRQGSSGPDGVITLARELDSRNRIMVLLHELAHELEHFRDERKETSREQKELEAESAAAVVCAMVGIEHPTARDYILMYQGDAEGLKASLTAIRRIVGTMVKLLRLSSQRTTEAVALAADCPPPRAKALTAWLWLRRRSSDRQDARVLAAAPTRGDSRGIGACPMPAGRPTPAPSFSGSSSCVVGARRDLFAVLFRRTRGTKGDRRCHHHGEVFLPVLSRLRGGPRHEHETGTRARHDDDLGDRRPGGLPVLIVPPPLTEARVAPPVRRTLWSRLRRRRIEADRSGGSLVVACGNPNGLVTLTFARCAHYLRRAARRPRRRVSDRG